VAFKILMKNTTYIYEPIPKIKFVYEVPCIDILIDVGAWNDWSVVDSVKMNLVHSMSVSVVIQVVSMFTSYKILTVKYSYINSLIGEYCQPLIHQ
jgi:hypothetical protein